MLDKRIQYNHDAESERNILRGTWFFQKSDGTLYPYSEDLAHEMTRTFVKGRGVARGRACVEVGDKRYVCKAEGGEFAQEHSETKTVRWVTRQFVPGLLEIKKVVPIPETEDEAAQAHGADERVWYFQRGNGCLQEYPPEVCEALNAAYPKGELVYGLDSAGVKVDEKRHVYRAVEGGWVQYHSESKTCRWVTDRFFEGTLRMKTVTPMIDALTISDTTASGSWTGRDNSWKKGNSGSWTGGDVSDIYGGTGISRSAQIKVAARHWWKMRARWGPKGDFLTAFCAVPDHEPLPGEEGEEMTVTSGEAVRVMMDEWERSTADLNCEAAVFAAKSILSMASGVLHHSTFSERRSALVERMVLLGLKLPDVRRTLFLSGDRLHEVALWSQVHTRARARARAHTHAHTHTCRPW